MKKTELLTPDQSTGQQLLEHLQKVGTWHGDDLDECLKLVYETRSPITIKNTHLFELGENNQ